MIRKLKIALLLLLVIIISGSVVGWFMWNKPKRNVAVEKGIAITSAQLVKEYQANEQAANSKYLDKAIQVTGTVTEVKSNQDGKTTITLASDDAFTGVFCTLRDNATNIKPGASITLKGICSGMLSDVRLRDAVIVNN